MRAYMKRKLADPEYRVKHNAQQLAWHKQQYDTDPEYRARNIAYSNEYRRQRLLNDPTYREHCREQGRKARIKLKADPIRYAKRLEYNRQWKRRKRQRMRAEKLNA